MRLWLLAAGLAAGLLAGSLAAVEVKVDASCPWIDRDGYTPVVLTLRADEPTEVQVSATFDDNQARTVIAVPAGEIVHQTLLIPGSLRRWSNSIEVTWRAPGGREERLGVSPRGFREVDVVVVDPEESIALKELREAVTKEAGTPPDGTGYRGTGTATYDAARFNRWAREALPDRWQGIPAWLTVLTTAAADRQLSDGQRQALAAWTHAGGRLFVADAAQLAGWRALGARAEIVDRAALTARIRQVWDSVRHAPNQVPVPDTGRVPVYGFVAIAVLFSLIVGPLNLWWCARQGRRHLLLLTTPLLSLVACTILLVYGIVADGLGTRRLAVQVLVLDQALGRAGIWQGISYFAGLAPGTIDLDPDDELAVIAQPDDRREQPSTELAWDAAQHATGGWIPARTNRQLAIATVRPERRRLTVVAAGEAWTATNGFDQPLLALAWHDPLGRPWRLPGELAPGSTATLIAGTLPGDEAPLGRLPVAATLAASRGTWTARFAAPLVPVAGPAAQDVRPPMTWVIGTASRPDSGAGKGGF